jgi:diacylglycerol kinase family enzyme
MRVLLIVNSSASSVTARGKVVIQKALAADHDVTVAETSRRGHATRLALGAATSGTEVVVVLGGDGTLNEAANGLAGSRTALAALPGGSTNVFARTIGLPNDPIEATGDLLAALAQGSIQRVGLGAVNGRYFLFHVGMGFDAAVVAQVERRASLKRYAGHPLFVYAAFSTWLRHYDRSRPRFAVHHADGTVIDDAYLAICLNTNPYTYLGNLPLNLAPGTDLDSGLAMLTLRTLSLGKTLRVVGSSFVGGRYLRGSKWTDHRTALTSVVVEGFGPFPFKV